MNNNEELPLQKNQIRRAVIEGWSSEAQGVCRIGGRAVFVKGAIPGETWDVRILKVTAGAVWARGETLLAPSPSRRVPDCPHFGVCGGCDTRHMTYDEELRFKLRRVNDALSHIGRLDFRIETILGAQQTDRCRAKCIFAVGERNGAPVTGFYRPRSHDLIPVEDCLLQPELASRAASALRAFLQKHRIPVWDEARGKGLVRHLFVRAGLRTGQAQCVVVSAAGLGGCEQALAQELRRACPELTSIALCINPDPGNVVLNGTFRTLWGTDCITEQLCSHRFELAPQAFFQINPPQAERLYEKAVEYAAPQPGDTVLDLYCGAGSISLCLADTGCEVIGAEVVPEAVENARRNAAANGMEHVRFLLGDAGEAAAELAKRGVRPAAVVVDPPRKGLSGQVIESVVQMQPARVVYVSCDPGTLARDLRLFDEAGYHPAAGTAVDMFPRTRHVETVVLLSRETNPLTVEVRMEVETGEVKEHPTYKRIQEYVQEKYGFK
ncbi:MAG: 23S rRNA (uracil(1939)-C(5))-methyltransferase RlmD, partial [Clostridiales bacterium]|nr:23S rRNA (uracil(1939)-C(5))-methyltransferase RlmD [Clostridiales bacterium]